MGDIGLFPLGIVLVPGEHVPLHIFEERYQELIGECIEKDAEFGLVLIDDSGLRTVGTRAAVVSVLERMPGGEMNIVVEGRERFRIVAETTGRSFRSAEIEPFDDEADAEPTPDQMAEWLRAYQEVVTVADAEPEELDLGAASLAFQIAGRVDFGPEAEQVLLEMRSERDRVTEVMLLLRALVEVLQARRVARERASGNGQVVSE